MTLRGVRHGKESASILLDDDDGSHSSSSSSSSDSSSGNERKSLAAIRSSSAVVAQPSITMAEPVSPQKKGRGKVRSSIVAPFSGRKNRPKSLPAARSAEIKVNRGLLPLPAWATTETPKSPVRSTSCTSVGSGKGMGMMFMSDMKGADDFFAYHNATIKEKSSRPKKATPTKDESVSTSVPVEEKAMAPRRSRTPFRAREKGTIGPTMPKHQRSKSMGTNTAAATAAGTAMGEIDTSSPFKKMVRSDHQTNSPMSKPRPTTPNRSSRVTGSPKTSEDKGNLNSLSTSSSHARKELVPVKIDQHHRPGEDVIVKPYAQLALGEVGEPGSVVGESEIDTSSPLKKMVMSEENLAAAAVAEAAAAAATHIASPVRRSTTPFRRKSGTLDQMTDQEKDALKYGAQPYRPKILISSGNNIPAETPARKTPLRSPSGDGLIQMNSANTSAEAPFRKTPLRAPSGDGHSENR